MLPAIAFLIYTVYSRSKYKNRAGAFFFENDSLVLNTVSYALSIKVIKKTGKTKRVFYKGYKAANGAASVLPLFLIKLL